MVNSIYCIIVALLAAVMCSVHGEETVHETGLHSVDEMSNSDHQAQKRMLLSSPSNDDDAMLLSNDGLDDSFLPEDYLDKRGSLLRFGKRQGSLFRFGKRGSLLRFGKRQGGSLLRFGKRGGSLFRFGRSGPAESPFEGSDRAYLSLLRRVLDQAEYENGPSYLDGEVGKRGVDSFHWGSESEK